jgi:riboflavin kinase/FMN adenylyltransferase
LRRVGCCFRRLLVYEGNVSNGALVVIGNFDGVHRGHQAVLAAVQRMASQRALAPRMLTFDPHPAVTLGRPAPALLTTMGRRRELIERGCPGIEVVVKRFTREFAAQSPEAFARDVLRGELDARLVMVGLNFRFGRQRSGSFADLERLGADLGFDAMAEPLVSDAQGAWSSTRVRGLLAAGDVVGAAELLGRPHMLSGVVTAGDKRGRTIGFPTANLADVPETLPPFGVYAVVVDRLETAGPRALAKGVANLGVRPTVEPDAAHPLLEVHLFDLEADLYGSALRVHLVARLRDEQRFDGLDALKAQIADDSARARELLAQRQPESPDGAWS